MGGCAKNACKSALVLTFCMVVSACGQWGDYWTNGTKWVKQGLATDLADALKERSDAMLDTYNGPTNQTWWIGRGWLTDFDADLKQTVNRSPTNEGWLISADYVPMGLA